MLNIIKSDIYKMFKMKSLWILNIIASVYNLLTAFVYSQSDETVYFYSIVSSVSFLLPMFAGIFMCIFTNSEYKKGYIKNIAGIISDKIYIIISKFVIAALFVLLAFVIHILTSLLFTILLCDSFRFSSGLTYEFADCLKFLGISYILSITFSMIPVALVTIAKNGVFAYIMTILISTGFLSSTINGIWMLLQYYEFIPESFDISDFFLTTYLLDFDADTIKSIIAAVAYTAVFGGLAMFSIKKRDI